MSATICLAPANTVAYPAGGGHLWVYLQWALGLRALGCRVTWLEVVNPTRPAEELRVSVATLRGHLARFGLGEALALCSPTGAPLPGDLAAGAADLDGAAGADLLLNLWHSLPAPVVARFRRSAFVDTDPGALQMWMTTGRVRVAPHDIYFTIGETVGTPAATFPDCGIQWHYTPPPVFLPEWPSTRVNEGAPYTTVAHWWGGTFEFRGVIFSNEKRVVFLEYLSLPSRTRAKLELAVCLAEHFEEYRKVFEPAGWRLREAWDVSSTPDDYRAYIQRSRGEFSCAKPFCLAIRNAWVSDRTLCYLASGKPAVVQHTGPSRFLPDAEGLFRFRSLAEAAQALEQAESDFDRQCRLARALAEAHFDAQRVVCSVLERALT